MAKLNKAESEQAARNMASSNPEVKAFTYDQIVAMEWKERDDKARAYAEEAALRVDSRYLDAFRYRYVSAVQSIWSGVEKNRENARRNFKRATEGLSPEQAEAKIVGLITAMNVRGARIDYHQLTIARVDPHRWSGPGLRWKIDRDYDDDGVRNPDDPSQRAGRYTLSFEISTSGSTYSLAEMAVNHKIHGELLDIANELSAVMAQERIVWTRGMPEPVIEPAPAPIAGGPEDDRLN